MIARRSACRTHNRRLRFEHLEQRRVLATFLGDLNALPSAQGSNPQSLVTVGGQVFFTATTLTTGIELWKTDGTSAGTTLVKDINIGSSNSSPTYLTNVNGTLLFRANDGINGVELWKSDGTAAGTTLVKDIISGSGNSSPSKLANINGTLFFRAADATTGTELWRSDGTAAGTTLVKDILSGSGSSSPSSLTNVNGNLFFTANDGTNGTELWRSDGTAAGTTLVKDISSGSSNSTPRYLTDINGTLFFSAQDGSIGYELWRSDGTAAGTTLVKDIFSGTSNSAPTSLTNVNGTLFFRSTNGTNGYELWRSDGTAAGTTLVKDISSGSGNSNPSALTNVNGTLFFSAVDATNGTELWRSNGTAAGTTLVKDILSGSGSSTPNTLTDVNGTLFFSANDGTNGNELWRSDGTTGGTTLIKDINSGSGSSSPGLFLNFNGTLFFRATDATSGAELWKSDGSTAGTTLVKDIYSGSSDSYPLSLTNVDGTLFFSAVDTNGRELWKSDGTAAGTMLVKDIYSGSSDSTPYTLTNVNGTLFFSANDGTNGIELWRSDGTAAGTTLVKDILSGSGTSSPSSLTNVNGTLFFTANNGINGSELWRSDGTAAGTMMVRDISGNSSGSGPTNFTNVNGTLYFRATGTYGTELWRSDGTAAGTMMVKDISISGGGSAPNWLTNVNGTLFFRANDGTNGYELWRSDGTAAGTTLVKDIFSGSNSSSPVSLTNVDGTLFFSAWDGINGYELWRSDGTAAGTTLVRDIRIGSGSSAPLYLTNLNGTLFFRATDGINGNELWRSDGTAAGTTLIDLGAGSAAPNNLLNLNGTLYFNATTQANGNELWKTDGTAAGTQLVAELATGSAGSNPKTLTVAGPYLFFGAGTEEHGRELWRVALTNITSGSARFQASLEAVENRLLATTVSATGVSNTYSITGGADAARLAAGTNTGEISFAANPNFEVPLDADGNNIYEVIVRVEGEDGDWDTQTLLITLTDQAATAATIYIDDDWSSLDVGDLISDADPNAVGNQPAIYRTTAFADLELSIDAVAAAGTVVMLPGNYNLPATLSKPFSLSVKAGTATISGTLNGASELTKTGSSMLTLNATNTFTGGLKLSGGKVQVAEDAALGASSSIVSILGSAELLLTDNLTTSRRFDLTSGTLSIASGKTLTLDGAEINGGFLRGPGTIATTAASNVLLNGSQAAASLTIHAGGSDHFLNFLNKGKLNLAAGKSFTFSNFENGASGQLTIDGTLSAADLLNYGQMIVSATGVLAHVGSSNFVFGGGSVTTIAAGGLIDIGASDARVAGGLVKNFGQFGSATNDVIVDYGGKVTGSGTFHSVVTQNGGVYSPGGSPGGAQHSQFFVNSGGVFNFEISNATGTAGSLSGWDLATVGPTPFNPSGAELILLATAANPYSIVITSRVNSGDRNTAGLAENFDAFTPYAWKFLDATNAVVSGSFDSAAFSLDVSGFQNATAGTFSVELREAGKALYVVYTPANRNPTGIALSATSIPENKPIGTVVGNFSSTDPDSGNTFTYKLVTGSVANNNGSFQIVGDQLKTKFVFNREVRPSYTIRVRTTDQNGLSFDKDFTITVTNVNERPTGINLSANAVAENRPIGTVVGNLSSADPDSGNTFTYKLVTGAVANNNGSFQIVGDQLKTKFVLNREVRPSYTIRVRTTDQNGLSFDKDFTITVTNVNERPTGLNLSANAVAENKPIGTVVGNLSSADPDSGSAFTYKPVTGAVANNNGSFQIVGNQLKTKFVFNHEVKPSYLIRVRTTDQNGLSFDKDFTITVTNVNERPTGLSLSATTVAENKPIGTVVGNLSSTDTDSGSSFTYKLVTGAVANNNGSFQIVGNQLKTRFVFNHEVRPSYSIRVRTTDQNGLSFDKDFTVNVANVYEGPTVGGISGSIGYVRGAVAQPITTGATLSGGTFAPTKLRVRITDGASAANVLGFTSSVTVDANNVVRLGTTIVGTRASNGVGTNDLLINFQSNVTRDIAQQVARALTFKTVAGAVAGPRKVLVSVFDGSLFSPEVSKLVSVS